MGLIICNLSFQTFWILFSLDVSLRKPRNGNRKKKDMKPHSIITNPYCFPVVSAHPEIQRHA